MIAAQAELALRAPMVSTCELPGDLDSVHTARTWVYGELEKHAGVAAVPTDVADLAVLLASELVTNAVRHTGSCRTGGTFSVEVQRRDDRVRIAVRDEGSPDGYLPKVTHPDDDQAETGRGLRIVAGLSTSHGYHCEPTGTTVYFELVWRGYDPAFPVYRYTDIIP
ncbi:ATP-binding protein [Allonocardiopsis opalescens]|uniref:Histidine kinase-like protein n=1 Tax=Allonocardiopsis opalescens TaxID=1144618 RepID=A0A2T0Q8F9_9ACTN|nr:ATP-binding protein [Allonocardiopsis opalescens]PRY00063.1 histidine kinase-like protein [Allonocardiopsis opalescens]